MVPERYVTTFQGRDISFRVLMNPFGSHQTNTGSYRPLRVHADNLRSMQSPQRLYELITDPTDLKTFLQTPRVLQACWKYSNRSYTLFFNTLQGPYTDASKSLYAPHGPYSSNIKVPTDPSQ